MKDNFHSFRANAKCNHIEITMINKYLFYAGEDFFGGSSSNCSQNQSCIACVDFLTFPERCYVFLNITVIME